MEYKLVVFRTAGKGSNCKRNQYMRLMQEEMAQKGLKSFSVLRQTDPVEPY